MTHGHPNIKFVNAKQAKETYQYRNTNEKLYKTIAAISYKNMQRKTANAQLYSHQNKWQKLTMPKDNKAATHHRLNQELKFLYVKKQKLNE